MKILSIIVLIFSYLKIMKIKMFYRLLSTFLHFKFIILHFTFQKVSTT